MNVRTLVILIVAAASTGCASTSPPLTGAVQDPAVQRGQAFAARRCSGCHAVTLDESPATSGPRFRDLRLRYNPISLEKRFAEISAHGTGEMPPIEITRAQAEDLIAYFESLGES